MKLFAKDAMDFGIVSHGGYHRKVVGAFLDSDVISPCGDKYSFHRNFLVEDKARLAPYRLNNRSMTAARSSRQGRCSMSKTASIFAQARTELAGRRAGVG